MANKVLLTWNIRPGKEREHFQRIREFVSKLTNLGLDLTDAWYTVYGEAPQILLGIVAPGGAEERLQQTMSSEQWKETLEEMREYITDYDQRLVKAGGPFQF
jgi:hypothetical protein